MRLAPFAPRTRVRGFRAVAVLALAALLAACGGGGGSDGGTSAPPPSAGGSSPQPGGSAITERDATRLAMQATFGPSEALVAEIRARGAAGWLADQMRSTGSRYTSGNGDAIDTNTSETPFCMQPAQRDDTHCWRDWISAEPLLWDFYRNATAEPDQLRQRVAFAWQQILVVSEKEVHGTYGFRRYHNLLLDGALGNYRDLLRQVAISPVMGRFLNNANNDRAAPNENFARELLQLFSIGTCRLAADGRLEGGACIATYDNDTVRAYAYALTGWTYPDGGRSAKPCHPRGANCPYYDGEMKPLPSLHDRAARTLLSGVVVPAGSTPEEALERVLDSVMTHPNIAPFIGRQLIQHLVTADPSPAYVGRVARAFVAGRHTAGGTAFGSGRRGDLAATVAAVLLDAEARDETPPAGFGRLKEPVQMFTAVLRALHGRTDGAVLAGWWGDALREHVFRPPSVFNFYPPDYPLPGSGDRTAPTFGIHNSDAALQRLNFLSFLLIRGGAGPDATVPNAIGTRVDPAAFSAGADDAGALVDRLSRLATGAPLPDAVRARIVEAVAAYGPATGGDWRRDRVMQAAYLVFASPAFQVQR